MLTADFCNFEGIAVKFSFHFAHSGNSSAQAGTLSKFSCQLKTSRETTYALFRLLQVSCKDVPSTDAIIAGTGLSVIGTFD
jgi:hypothetical protein